MIRLLKSGGGGHFVLPLFILLSLLLLSVPGPQPVSAQTIQGQLLNGETLEPIEGVLVLLLGPQGKEHYGYLTNAAGRFILKAPGAGTYQVRADRIGFETTVSEAFTLELSQIFGLRMEMAETAIQLAELRVEGEQQCVVRPGEGLLVAQVWDEAQKALTVQEWTEREGLYRFQVVNYERDLDAEGRRVESETRRVVNGVSRSPIRSLPAEELMETGFVQRTDDGGWTYFGPDANVLLSDEFLDTHCFHLRTDIDFPTDVGLAFEPVRQSDLPDISGTLWLDGETGALRFLEFRYTWAEYPEARGVARGRVEFEELPNGAWIVRRWWIRMPRLSRNLGMAQRGRSGVFVSGMREAGAEVANISTLDRQRIAQVERGFLSGIVWDSTRYAPLTGANVFLSGTSYSTTSNAEGRFLLEGIREGVYSAAFTHPRLDTMGVFAPGVEVEIFSGDMSEVILGVPALGSILVEACRGEERTEGLAVVTGLVRDRSSGEPLPRATVSLRWLEVGGVTGHLESREVWVEATTDGDGRFSTCKVPANHLIIVEADFLDRRSDTVHIRVPEDSYTVVDLEIWLRSGMIRSGGSD